MEKIVERQRKLNGFSNYVEREREHIHISEIEKRIDKISQYEESLGRLLKQYGILVPIRKISENLFSVQPSVSAKQLLSELPAGFLYVGGTARAALERSLGLHPFAFPRDTDIVFSGEVEDCELISSLSQKFMPEDYAHGHGVKKETEEYLETRDFTINEVFVAGSVVYFTKECLLDTVRGILRFTAYEKRHSYTEGAPYYVNKKLLAKALRFAAQYDMDVIDSEPYVFQEIDSFHMALHLDRCWQTGEWVAQGYVDELRERGQIPAEIQAPSDLLAYLNTTIDFVFRYAPKEEIELERRFIDHVDMEALESLPSRTSMHKP